MSNLVRFVDPKKEKMYVLAAKNGKESIYASVAYGKEVNCDEITVALARTAYECFYSMSEGGLNAGAICQEIDDFMDLMKENLPKVKKNIWSWEEGGSNP